MSDFNVRADSVDVEQIMRQIRARIREKRGADYTEAEIQQLAKVKLEKFLDPKGVRSDLMDQFRRQEFSPSAPLPKLEIKDFSIYGTHRGALRWIRQMLQPILKLFINPNPLVHFVWTQTNAQSAINDEIELRLRQREQVDAKLGPLYYEMLHNLVLELTRAGIEIHNLKMRVESMSSRLDFDERRSRSLERAVEYRPNPVQRPPQPAPSSGPSQPPAPGEPQRQSGQPGQGGSPGQGGHAGQGGQGGQGQGGDGTSGRRRRRRRRRRPGHTMGDQGGQPAPHGQGPQNGAASHDAAANDADGPESFDDVDDGASDQ
jgi:hypothetical protein